MTNCTQQKTAARSAGIVLHNNQLLIMYRIRNGQEYYTFPGGTVEPNETTQQAASREIFEETTIQVVPEYLCYQMNIESTSSIKEEFFYWCTYISGTPKLDEQSIESIRQSSSNFYEPRWFPISELSSINLYPIEIRNQLILDLKHGFKSEPLVINISKEKMLSA